MFLLFQKHESQIASLKVKRLKQETVGNKQEVVETDLGEESPLQAGTPTKADLGKDSPLLGRPSHL